MNLGIKNYGGLRFVTGIIRSAFLLLIFGAQIQAQWPRMELPAARS
jgi:hypothetical protein